MSNNFFKKGVALVALFGLTVSPLAGVPFDLQVETAKANGVEFASGDGSFEDPFRIATCTHLQNIDMEVEASYPYLDDYYELDDDIDCTDTVNWAMGNGFNPIGDNVNRFAGNFDGRGKTITGLTVNRSDLDYAGLFGFVDSEGAVTDVNLVDVDIVGQEYVGGLVGSNLGSISYVSVQGDIESTIFGNVGGVLGQHFGVLENSYARATIDSTWDAGPLNLGVLVGSIRQGSLINKSYAVGTIQSTNPPNPAWEAYGPVGSIIDSGGTHTVSATLYDSTVYASGQRTEGYIEVGTPQVTADMKDIETFTTDLGEDTWDFDTVWNIDPGTNDGYPYIELRSPEPEEPVAYQYEEGSGTLSDPFEIRTCEDLQGMDHADYMGLAFELRQDIDCSMTNPDDDDWAGSIWEDDYEGFNPIGYYTSEDDGFDPETVFYGHLNGNGYEIRDLFISRPGEQGVGLFATIAGPFSDEPSYIDYQEGEFEELYPDLSGALYASIFNFDIVDPVISAQGNVGALAGNSLIRTESIEGSNFGRQPVIKFVNVVGGNISARNNFIGGLIGRDRGADVSRTSFEGDIYALYSDEANYNEGVFIGGLMAQGYRGNSRLNSFTKATLYIDDDLPINKVWAAGLIAFMQNSTYADAYSASSFGAAAGFDTSKVYLNDPVEINSYGALQNGRNAYFDSSLWNLEPSNVDDNDNSSMARTTFQMNQGATYEGWNFSCVWKIHLDENDGYPELITVDEWIENGCKENAQEPSQGQGDNDEDDNEDPNYGGGGGSSSGSRSVKNDVTTKASFTDVSVDDWAKDYIEKLAEKCDVTGYADSNGAALNIFGPGNEITRAEILKIIMGCDEFEFPKNMNNPYSDLAEKTWYTDYILYATKLGWVSGYSDGEFKPNQYVTRAEAMKIILLSMMSESEIIGGEMNFEDTDSTEWYAKYVAYAVSKGWVSGYVDETGSPSGEFRPNQYVTRAEAAKVVVKAKGL